MLKTTDYGLPDPSGLLPARPIMVRRAGFADHYRLLVFSILLGFGALAIVATIWPGLYADYRILRAPVDVPQASMVDGECRMRKFSVRCNAIIAYPRDGAIQSRAVSFSYMAFRNEDRETRIVAERGNPDNITLSLAIEEFWNRFLGSLLVVLVFAVFSVLMMRRFLYQSASIKAMRDPALLRPVWARITQRTDKRGQSRITYAPIDPAMTGKAIASGFRKDERPWTHYDPAQDETFTLAVVHPNATLPVLLDERLDRLDLTPDEADAIRVRRDALLPPEPTA
ncbi:hypothetical protein ACR720_03850 [Sphingomonas parapaucimobilis]|uniref:hypothetical protein n=1 Tax=Sphingomonas parapaucimobilis TaxID=28213 RepID=UPI0039E8E976